MFLLAEGQMGEDLEPSKQQSSLGNRRACDIKVRSINFRLCGNNQT